MTPLADSTLRDAHDKGKSAIGRPLLRVHDLRRTAATLAAQGGATVAELMRLLGHTTVVMAMRYQVASEERELRAVPGAASNSPRGPVAWPLTRKAAPSARRPRGLH